MSSIQRYLLSHILYLKVKARPSKTALLIPGKMHLRLEVLCFLFYFIFCFGFLLCVINTFPSEEAKHSLFCSPCCWFWLRGIGVGVGKREAESIFIHKDNSFSLTGQQLQREFDIWGDWVARVILIYLATGTEAIGNSKWSTGARISQGFGGGNTEQVKKKK